MRGKFKVITRLLVLILTAALLLSTQVTGASAAAPKYKYGKLKIQALGGGACGAPSYVAFEKGFFKEEGLDVTLVSGTFDALRTGLGTGEFTIANGDFQFFPSIQNGLKLRIIGGLHKGCIKLVLPPNSPIKSVKDLKGKRIGVEEIGGTPYSITTVALANEGIDPKKDVEFKQYPIDQLSKAALKGEVDAFATWDPFGVLAVNDEKFTVLIDIGEGSIFGGKSCCFLFASQKKIDENPEKVAAIARAYKKATEWIKAHPKETAELEINKKYVAAKDVNLLANLIKSYSYEYTTTAAYKDAVYFADQFKKTGILKAGTDSKKFIDKVYYDVFNPKKKK